MKRRLKQQPQNYNRFTEGGDEDDAPVARKPSTISNMSLLDRLSEGYARIMCRMSGESRLRVYRKLMSLLKNRFSLMDSLDRVFDIISNNGKNPGEPMAMAISAWSRSLRNGDPFSVAIKGWAPSREALMLSTGDVSHLDEALENLIKVTEGSAKMIAPMVNATMYPAFLSIMVVMIIYGVGAFLVPPMAEAAPGLRWTGMASDLVVFSTFVQENWVFIFSIPPVAFFVIWVTLPRWKGKSRAWFDRMPPWSLYRIFVGVSWLLTFSALVKAGTPVSKAMRALRADANPYLLERIDRSLVYINNGDNIGDALLKTGYDFPDPEIVGDLRIYSELDNFQEALNKMANEWLEESVKQIEQKAAILNTVAILSVVAIVGWAVMGTFEMQDQISRAIA